MIYYLLFLTWVSIYSLDDEDFRKHYGLSFHNQCDDYVKSFKCMTTCKMMGFQIFRMNFNCKCSCHDMKTSTILPFFKWRTNGTTKTVPKTQSPRLYDVVGPYTKTETQTETKTEFSCPTLNYSALNYSTSIASDDDGVAANTTATTTIIDDNRQNAITTTQSGDTTTTTTSPP